jgi:hypothetical protein
METTLQRKSHLCIPFLGLGAASVLISTFMCLCERFKSSQDRSTYWLQKNRQILEIYKSLTDIYECRNWETEHYNTVLEIRRLHSFISGNT